MKPGQKAGTGSWTMDKMFDMFSKLKERADVEASVMSGGEQQMLTMCRTLMGDPELVMIDEPTEGLSPQMVKRVADVLQEIAKRGVATLLVEQKLSIAMDIADRVYVMGHGQVQFEGTPDELRGRDDVRKEWLEV
jgi:branched-chain amino acid transport system ATP-binding protein